MYELPSIYSQAEVTGDRTISEERLNFDFLTVIQYH
jgi:hypothetical protein